MEEWEVLKSPLKISDMAHIFPPEEDTVDLGCLLSDMTEGSDPPSVHTLWSLSVS